MTDRLRIALTPGEPAGIGPDLSVMLAQTERSDELVAIADPELLYERARQLGLPLQIREFDRAQPACADRPGSLCVEPISANAPVVAGRLDASNAGYVLATLDLAIRGCIDSRFDAMLTAPVHKGIINDSGVPFSGHTEYIANMTGGYPVMMLLCESLRVALATTHLAVSEVPAAINQALLIEVLNVINTDLRQRFAITEPRILVCGLNPHAGEGGHLGREEIDVIEPALARCRESGINAIGPLPADTLFTPRHLDQADAVLAMYHDQGLPVLKYAGFGNAVNLTLGLPIIRTSVDHGTATDLAGTGRIDAGSIRAALALAQQLCRQQHTVRQ